MKKIIYSLVIMIAAGSLFTSCLEYVEPVGIQQLRAAKADYLDALAQLRLADAELQKANAAYVLAQAAYVDAQTEWQLIENRIHEYDVQIKAAQTDYEVDSLKKKKELLQVQHDTKMANAKAALATAEENLRVTLRDIAAVQHLLTVHERFIFNGVLAAYEEAFDVYNDKLMDLEKAKAKLWSLEYGFKDSIDWEADYQGNIDFYTAEIAIAQAALQNVPKNLDLEAWNAEVENLKDSIKAYNYGRQANTADSVYYMVNVYHEGVEKYERAFEAWLAQFNGKVTVSGTTLDVSGLFTAPAVVAKPAKPEATYNKTRVVLNSTKAIDYVAKDIADPAAKLVYDKYVDLIADYKQQAPFGKDSTLANGGWYGNVINGAGSDTLRINATVDMKDFILNDSTATPKEYKWVRRGTPITSVGKYGLVGALNILERELVLIEQASKVADAQKAYDNARSAWEADRAYLISKAYETEEAAALADFTTSTIIPTPAEGDGRTEDLMYAIKDFRISRTDSGKESSTADTVQFIQAVTSFVKAKAAYIGQAYKGKDTLEFKDAMNNDRKLYLGDLELSGFVQKKVDAAPKYSSIYGGKSYQTTDDHLNKAPVTGADDAILKVLRVLFPNNLADLANWTAAEAWIDGATFKTDALEWFVYDADGTTQKDAAKAPSHEYIKTEADRNLEGKASVEFLKVYNRFWNPQPAVTVPADAKWDAGCYTENTFKKPYNLVRFTGADVNEHQDLKVVLSLVDPNSKPVVDGGKGYDLTHEWNGKVNTESAILGTAANPSEFRTMLYKEQLLIIEQSKTTYKATLDKIRAFVAEVEKAFDDAKTAVDNKYTSDSTKYEKYVADKKKYDADVKAKKEELLTELTGKKDGKVVATIAEPTSNTHDVPSCMTEYLDHEGNKVYNGTYSLGGKQLAWANDFLPAYPAKLKEWMIATRTANHVIGHLNSLGSVLDAAYTAATGIYQYEWEKYVLSVDPTTHEYEVDVDAIRRNYDAAGAATLLKYFDNYNRFQRQYVRAWEKYLEDCTAELGFWKKVLAAYNAGYDPLEMAIKEQKNVVEQLEKEVEIAKKKLELAEAEYKETLAKLLN